MSGGSWDYVYHKIEDTASQLKNEKCPAMHDIEWVDSCDYSKGQEEEAIRAALGGNADALILQEGIEKASAVADELTKLIEQAQAVNF